ncbi:YpzG family protein [Lysinibacillus yapensis]|uniref:YpzG family protein n=1 Tax=Ureibacillus yapensis TaxID=2304605 RepID=A0A396SKI4_9BACL|nr:YpzG family protein [Lysinibacillus yapensis]RHW34980.1 YpzG family protein [Lysinibacillus yapensis]
MDKKGLLNPHTSKTHHNWAKPKFQKSQMNGQTEVSLNNQILRINAKARHW